MRNARVHIAALFSMLFWGFSFIWSKMVFEEYTPLTTIFFRLIISFIFLFALMLAVVAAVVYTVFLKKLAFKYKPVTVIGWQNLIGAIYGIKNYWYGSYYSWCCPVRN